jgi:hypothetical protein
MSRRVNFLPSSRLVVTALSVALCSMASAQSTDSLRVSPIPRSPFRISQSFALAPAPTSVASGDLNGDGYPDLVVTRTGSGGVSVLLGNGKGGFSAGVVYPAGTTVSNALVADFNGDGRLDVAVTDSSTGSVDVLFGNGDGTFGAPSVYPALKDPVALTTGHFANSGKLDLAVASSTGLSVLLNDGTGKFSSPAAVPITVQPRSIAAADLKGAGHDDLILASQDGSLTILLGDGAGHFAAQPALAVASGPLSSVAAGDFNADGKADLAVAQGSSNVVSVLLGKGDGSFEAGSPYVVGNGPAKIIAADLTGSGATDLVSLNQLSNTFSVLVGNGDGTFRSSIDFVAGNLPLGLVAADFNGDGKADLAIANSLDQNIAVPLGHGDGTFAATRSYRADLVSKAVAAGDLNGDGRSDLVVINYCGADTACSSNGTATVFLANTDGSYRAGSTIALGSGPVAVALADLHGNGKLDLVALNSAGKALSILAGNGDGTFGATQRYSLAASPRTVLAGDFNGDGKTDLAIASDCGQSTCTQPGTLDIWLGHGDGSLQASASYTVGFSPVSIAAADLRSTGHLDIVVANACGNDSTCNSSGTATIFANDGTAKLTAAGEVSLGSSPSAIAIGNLTGNGLDLAVAQRGSNQVAVLHSNGNGTFAAPVTYAVGTAPSALAIADFNGDGQPDLAVANAQSSNVSVLYSAGGKLQTAVNFPVSADPESLAAIAGGAGRAAGIVTSNGSTASPMGGGATPLGGGGTNTSTTALANAPNTSTVNGSVTLTATVTGDGTNGAPTGNVVFAIDNGASTTPLSDCGGSTGEALSNVDTNHASANCTTQVLTAGSLNLQAQYLGDSVYAASNSTDQVQTVAAASTTVTVNSTSPATPIVDQSATITATVAPSSGTAVVPFAGTMSFSADASPISGCSAQTVNTTTGVATCSYNGLTAGSHNLTAAYNTGDANYSASSTSANFPVSVNKAATTVTVNSISPTSPTVDQIVTLTATVQPTTGTAVQSFAGTMSFSLGGTSISGCTAQPVNSTTGVATCQISTGLAVGAQNFTATYSGDSNYNVSPASANFPVTVAVAPTRALVSPAPSTITVDQSVTLTATITPNVTSGEVATADLVAMTGNVRFSDNGTAISGCTAQGISFASGVGTATCTTSSLTAGTHNNIVATYLGDSNYNSSPNNSTATVTVNKASSTVAVTSNPTTPTLNNPVTYTAAITFPNPLTVIPTGTVSFSDNGTTITGCSTQAISVTGSTWIYQATCNQSSLTGGSHAIIAAYSGDANYNTSSGNLSLSVSAASTTTTVTAAPSPSSVNQSVTFTVKVLGGNTVAVTGTATVTADGTNTLGTCTLSGWTSGTSTASCSVSSSSLTKGTHGFTASYSGDSNYSNSTSTPAGSLTVNQTSTTLGLTTSGSPSTVNQASPVIFTATVTPSFTGSVVPTGSVSFTATPSGGSASPIAGCTAVTISSGGIATCSGASLVAGTYTINASYTGDSNFGTSTATGVAQTVNKGTSSVSVSGAPNPSTVNASVTFTATITPSPAGGIAPSGTVSFTDKASTGPTTAISGCTNVSLNVVGGNSVATCTTATLVLGLHTITATYANDSNFTGNTGTASQTVNAATSSITLNSSSPLVSGTPTSSVNQTVTFTANIPVPSGSTTLTGTVAFKDGASTIAGCAAVAPQATQSTNWVANCADPSLTAGNHTITAAYSGDSNFSVTGGSLTQAVNKATTTLAVSSTPDPSAVNESVTFTASLTAPSGSLSPNGTVNFTDSVTGTSIPTCAAATLSSVGGTLQATCTTATLTLGNHSVTASYGSDANFANSSNSVAQTVNPATTSIALVTSANPVTVNQSATFTSTITVPSGTATLTGTETFTDTAGGHTVTVCSGVAPQQSGSSNNWIATCVDNTLTAGNHTITATYGGDPNFTVNAGNVTQQVLQAQSTTAITSSSTMTGTGVYTSTVNNPNNVNDQVTFTAMVSPAAGAVPLSGAVTFSDNGQALTGCAAVPVSATGIATCVPAAPGTGVVTLTSGANAIAATYTEPSGAANFISSTGSLTQNVSDFSLSAATAPPVIVSAGFTTSNDPFTAQTMSVGPVSTFGFSTASGTPLSLTCAVTNSSGTTVTAPACKLFALGTTNPASTLAVNASGAEPALSLVVDATTAAAGNYTVTVTGTDPTTGLVHTASFAVKVRAVATALQVASGATTNNSGNVTFLVPTGVTLSNFACPYLAGSGITASSGVKPSNYGMACTFGTPSVSGNTVTVQVTVTTNNTLTTASSTRHSDLLVAGVFGLPFFGLVGLLSRKRGRMAFFQLMGLVAISIAALQTMGCGGSFHSTTTTTTSGGTTPPGVYYLLVQGTGSDGNTYQAVLPVNVTVL